MHACRIAVLAAAALATGCGSSAGPAPAEPLPTLELSAASLGFSAVAGGGAPAARTVTVGNAGGGTLARPTATVTYQSGADWLTAAVSGAAAPYTVTVEAAPGALPAATYQATVRLASAGATNSPQEVAVTLTVAPAGAPVLVPSATSLQFTAEAGGADPAPQQVTVTNGGPSPLAAPTATVAPASATWLTATVTGAAPPYTVSVQAATGALAVGPHAATVTLAAPGAAPQDVSVTFTVTAPPAPVMVLSATALDFTAELGGAAPAAQEVTVTSGSPTPLAAPSAAVAPVTATWLTATVTGSAPPYTVTVQADVGAVASGLHLATVTLASPGAAPVELAVTFTVTEVGPPVLLVNPGTLRFDATLGGAAPAALPVQVTNGGQAALAPPTVTVSPAGATWLGATVSGEAPPYTVTVQATLIGLAAGTHQAALILEAPGALPVELPVTFVVVAPPPPLMVLSGTALSFAAEVGGPSPAAQAVTVGDGSATPLAALAATVATPGATWLTAAVTGSAAPFTVTVQAATGALAAGTYAATVALTAPGAAPRDLAVTFTVTPAAPPVLVLSSTALQFTAEAGGASPAAQQVTVTNGGPSPLAPPTATVSPAGATWLAATVSGAVPPYVVTVQAATGALPAGSHAATITLSAPGAVPQDLSVTFTVTAPAPPVLVLSTALLQFTAEAGGASPAAQQVTVTNGGPSPLAPPTATVSPAGATWLTATVSGAVPPYVVTVQAATGALPAGTHGGVVTLASPGAAPRDVAVTFTVTQPAPPVMVLSATTLQFAAELGGAAPASQQVTVTNGGPSPLAAPTATVPPAATTWLSATVTGAAPPYTVTVQASVGALPPGIHQATIALTAPGAAPRDLAVTFTVTEVGPPILLVSPGALQFSAVHGGAAPAAQPLTVDNGGIDPLPAPTATVTPSGAGWLTAAVTGATAPYTVSVQASLGTLLPGVHQASVLLEAAGAVPVEVPVTFTVAFPRTVTVTRLVSFWQGGPTPFQVPDPDLLQVTLLQDGGAGGPLTVPATPGAAPGTFTAGALPGAYWVALSWASGAVTWVRASADALDLGDDRGGRADRVAASPGTTATLSVLNFELWDLLWDVLKVYSWGTQGLGSWFTNPPLTIQDQEINLLGFTVDWPGELGALLEPADTLYVVQQRGRYNPAFTLIYEAGLTFTTVTGASLADGADTAIAPPDPASTGGGGSVAVNWRRSTFEAAIPAGVPVDPYPHRIGVYGLQAPIASPAPLGAVGLPLLETALAQSNRFEPADFNYGPLAYSRYLGAGWSELFSASYTLPVTRTAPGATAPAAGLENRVLRFDSPALVPTLITPLLGGVRTPTIDGLDALAAQAGRSTTPTLAWTAPATGTPTSYRVGLSRLEAVGGATRAVPLAQLVLPATTTTLTLPAGLLQPGQAYAVELTARASPGDASGASPFRMGVPFGEASVWTAVFTTAP